MGGLVAAIVWELDEVALRNGGLRFSIPTLTRQQQAQAAIGAVADWLEQCVNAGSFTLGNDDQTAKILIAILREAARHTMSGNVSKSAGPSPPATPSGTLKEK